MPLPPVGLAVVGVHVHEELAGLLPDEERHGEGESGDAEHEEGQGAAAEDVVDAGSVEQEDEDDGLEGDAAEHVLVEGGEGEGDLSGRGGTLRDLQAKTLDHCTITMVTK